MRRSLSVWLILGNNATTKNLSEQSVVQKSEIVTLYRVEQLPREQLSVEQEPVILVACLLPGHQADPNDPLGELRSLVDTAGGKTVDELIQMRQTPDPATFLGKGKTQELGELARMHGAKAVIFDHDLSPSQIGNIEEVVHCKVLDRSELILDIFAARAQTLEARLQVEIAQLEYTYPRLRAMWTHLERIAGGAPTGIGTRGPGEQQLEIDRRIVQRKRAELKRELTKLQARRTREVEARNDQHFTVGLVGYTNAGKSTLFNTVIMPEDSDKAYADDKLFATLSTRTRRWDLGSGHEVMLSDTVGFVRDLPHHLVASFKATLEEAVYSDLLLIVLDISHPRHPQQMETVIEVLDDIGANQQPRLILFNKIDKLDHQADLIDMQNRYPDSLGISARDGLGMEVLRERILETMLGGKLKLKMEVSMQHGRLIQFLESRCEIETRDYTDSSAIYEVTLGQRQLDQIKAMGLAFKAEHIAPGQPHHGEQVSLASKRTSGWN